MLRATFLFCLTTQAEENEVLPGIRVASRLIVAASKRNLLDS